MILIVEDDPQVSRLIELVLKRMGRESKTMSGGDAALMQARAEHPSLVIADLGVKGLAGDALCSSLKSDDQTRGIPVIILSGDRDIREKADTCGADAYLGKPFEFEELTRLVEKYADDDKAD